MKLPRNTESYDYDHCDECRSYGDDYDFDEDGEMVCNCFDCPFFCFDIDDA